MASIYAKVCTACRVDMKETIETAANNGCRRISGSHFRTIRWSFGCVRKPVVHVASNRNESTRFCVHFTLLRAPGARPRARRARAQEREVHACDRTEERVLTLLLDA